MSSDCAHEYELRYTRMHPGKVAECPSCEAKFRDGEQVYERVERIVTGTSFSTPEGQVTYTRDDGTFTFELEAQVIENAKVVKAVATVNALTPEEYALVLALTERKVERVVVKRGPRKKKGLPEAVAEAAK